MTMGVFADQPVRSGGDAVECAGGVFCTERQPDAAVVHVEHACSGGCVVRGECRGCLIEYSIAGLLLVIIDGHSDTDLRLL